MKNLSQRCGGQGGPKGWRKREENVNGRLLQESTMPIFSFLLFVVFSLLEFALFCLLIN